MLVVDPPIAAGRLATTAAHFVSLGARNLSHDPHELETARSWTCRAASPTTDDKKRKDRLAAVFVVDRMSTSAQVPEFENTKG